MNPDPTRCAICGTLHDDPDFASSYMTMVCRACEARAVNEQGDPPRHGPPVFHKRGDDLVVENWGDHGDNPLYIDGHRCWRRYRFGGYITLRDLWDCPDVTTFYENLSRIQGS